MGKLKIGIYSFYPFPIPCGQTIRMLNILKYLSKSNKIIVYCPVEENEHVKTMPIVRNERSINIKNFDFKLNYNRIYNDFKVCYFLKKEYENGNFDILQLENSEGAYNLISRCNFPMVGVFHGRLHREMLYSAQLELSQGNAAKSLALRLLQLYTYFSEKKLAQKADRVIVTSDLVKEYAVDLGANPNKIRLLPNGVDLKEYQDYSSLISKYDLRRKLGLRQDAFIFVFHGSLIFDQNIEAIKNILKIRNQLKKRKSEKNWFFLIIGGPLNKIEKLKERVKDIDNVFFTGYVKDVKPYLFAADCGLAPFPEIVQPGGPRLKIIEFLAAGLPVITTKTGISGLEELTKDHSIYLLEKLEDLEKLLTNLRVKTDREKLKIFDWSTIAAENERVLKETLKSH